ncbi:DUF3231 family protein [Bacillus salitolerans]|uniref:DUF3231 family protein n=1 Tax=Bacillus salitolerans TaxID=1437434 RepID=A0ABW4LVK3_9BACI
MGNPFEALWNTIKTFVDVEEKSPLNIIEVGDCWQYLTTVQEFIRYEEIGLNTTKDDEVKEMLHDALKLCKSQSKRLSDFMIKEGIPLSVVASPKPDSDNNDIPLGVKLTDDEIVNGVAFKFVTISQLSSKGQVDAIRNDVAMMWLEYYSEIVTFGATLRVLMRKRGWLKVPPYYVPPGNPIK